MLYAIGNKQEILWHNYHLNEAKNLQKFLYFQISEVLPRSSYQTIRLVLSFQHFPLYRLSDAVCTEPDAPPLPEREKRFRTKIDALSNEATSYLVSKIKPRAVFGGHTHHGCFLQHSYETPDFIHFNEYSIPSFSWRNRADPKFLLVRHSLC